MAYSSLLSFSVCFLVLFHGCFAHIDLVTNRGQSQHSQQSQRNQCQLQNLNALEPKHLFKSEAGVTEFWDQNEDQFQCAGVAFLRHTIQRKGLLLPSFENAPQLIYVVEGEGIQGATFPGCPETYQSLSQQSQSRKEKQQSSRDQHQKLRRIKKGDIIALPTGVAHWIHNDGQSQLVLVSLVDVGNNANQLDQNFRKFFLAGNPQEGLVTGGQRQRQSQSPRGEEDEQQQSGGNNLLSGILRKFLAEAFGIDTKLARKLQNENDNRGAIVKMEQELTSPEETEEEQRQQGREEEEEEEQSQQGSEEEEEEEQEDEDEKGSDGESGQRRERKERGSSSRRPRQQGRKGHNGLEETFCSMSLRHRTDSSFADVFNPQAGRITSINSYKFPILQFLQLSAERGVLFKNASYAPHWNINAHSVVYITRGSGRMQIVSENGDAIFDDEVEQGQVIVVPQNFAVVKKASSQGLEWIAFKTNANAKVSQIAGRVSVFRGLPADVIANAFDISREEAMRLKQSRQVSLVSPRQGSQQ